jgi:hypothetical protein
MKASLTSCLRESQWADVEVSHSKLTSREGPVQYRIILIATAMKPVTATLGVQEGDDDDGELCCCGCWVRSGRFCCGFEIDILMPQTW